MRSVVLAHPGIYDAQDPRAFPPWGVLSVASALRSSGWQVAVLDLNGRDVAKTLKDAVVDKGASVVGLTAKAGLSAVRMRNAVDALRSEFGHEISIVVGGPLVSTFPDPSLPLWAGLDMLVLGDGEQAFQQLSPPGRRDLPDLVGPLESQSYLDFDGALWWESLSSYVGGADAWPNFDHPAIHFTAGRGCTRRCTFCYLNHHSTMSRFRHANADKLFLLLSEFDEKQDVRGFFFVDDCFIDRRRDFIKRFSYLNSSAGVPYNFGLDAQLVDLEDAALLQILRDMGTRALYVGIESGSASVRRALGKGSIHRPIRDLVYRARDHGIVIRASVGVGWPGETLDDMRQTLALIDEIPWLAFDAYKFLPLPRTPLGDSAYWTAKGSKGTLAEASNDYSGRNGNFSSVDDESFAEVWTELCQRESSRLRDYSAGKFDVW